MTRTSILERLDKLPSMRALHADTYRYDVPHSPKQTAFFFRPIADGRVFGCTVEREAPEEAERLARGVLDHAQAYGRGDGTRVLELVPGLDLGRPGLDVLLGVCPEVAGLRSCREADFLVDIATGWGAIRRVEVAGDETLAEARDRLRSFRLGDLQRSVAPAVAMHIPRSFTGAVQRGLATWNYQGAIHEVQRTAREPGRVVRLANWQYAELELTWCEEANAIAITDRGRRLVVDEEGALRYIEHFVLQGVPPSDAPGRPAWRRALAACWQQIPGPNHLRRAHGDMARGPVGDLLRALSPEQVEVLGWLSLADLAVWPQLPLPQANALVEALAKGNSVGWTHDAVRGRVDEVTVRAAQALLRFASQAAASRREGHGRIPDPDLIRTPLNALAQLAPRPSRFWAGWLRRVVPPTQRIGAVEARSLAVEALRCTLPIDEQIWEFEAGITEEGEVDVFAVSPGCGGEELLQAATMSGYEPTARTIDLRVRSQRPLDRYRMGYLHQGPVAKLTRGWFEGEFDRVVLTHSTTAQQWRYAPV